MNAARHARLWTAALVAAAALYLLAQSAGVFAYGASELRADPRAHLARFADDPRVGALARRKLLASEPDVWQVENQVALAPLAGDAWLALAAARMRAGAEWDKVAGGLAMSALTAPNESWLMGARAVFGAPLWSRLPAPARATLARDIVLGWDDIETPQRVALKTALEFAPPQTRAGMQAAILAAGPRGALAARTLGLADTPAPQPKASP